ncbi:Proteasome subunit beta type-6 [Ceratobasidium sp. 414]|nr:Proteasome subunit beta type-6 [Ceratobasidium sp. 414]
MSPTAQPTQRGFNPYTENGGTILAIAGEDFAVIAGDTRQTEGYSIQTRYAPKVFRLTDKAVLAVNGFAADGNMFVKKWYRHAHAKDMPLRAIARLIQTMLYAKRFFPYYVYNILSGIEEDGSGAVYSFDPVGSYEREACRAAGAAQSLVQPFLDNQHPSIHILNEPDLSPSPSDPVFASISRTQSLPLFYSPPLAPIATPAHRVGLRDGWSYIIPPVTSFLRQSSSFSPIYFKNQQGVHPQHLPLPHVLALVTDSFTSATERHIEHHTFSPGITPSHRAIRVHTRVPTINITRLIVSPPRATSDSPKLFHPTVLPPSSGTPFFFSGQNQQPGLSIRVCGLDLPGLTLEYFPDKRTRRRPISDQTLTRCSFFVLVSSLDSPLVGDGLEIYVLLAPGHPAAELAGVAGASEVTTETAAGERVFVIRRELKKD